jgi:hypothetical protein
VSAERCESSKDCRQGRTPPERTLCNERRGVCALVWCCSCSHNWFQETWTAMLDYLGMRVRQECCEFEDCKAGRTPLERTSVRVGGALCAGVAVAVAATHPVPRNLDSNVGLFRNEQPGRSAVEPRRIRWQEGRHSERTSVQSGRRLGVCVLWCGVAAAAPGSKKLGQQQLRPRCEQESVSFEGSGREKDHLSAPLYEWAAPSGVCALVQVLRCSHPPGSKKLGQQCWRFRNRGQAGVL